MAKGALPLKNSTSKNYKYQNIEIVEIDGIKCVKSKKTGKIIGESVNRKNKRGWIY